MIFLRTTAISSGSGKYRSSGALRSAWSAILARALDATEHGRCHQTTFASHESRAVQRNAIWWSSTYKNQKKNFRVRHRKPIFITPLHTYPPADHVWNFWWRATKKYRTSKLKRSPSPRANYACHSREDSQVANNWHLSKITARSICEHLVHRANR